MPVGTAFFGPTSVSGSNISISANTTIGGWTFNPGASFYNFTDTQTLQFTGAGIIINGAGANIVSGMSNGAGSVTFNNNSTAGSASIGIGNLTFNDRSTAGSASIGVGSLTFNNHSTASNANISTVGTINFNDASTADNATIRNIVGVVNFNNSSTAGNAIISTGAADVDGVTNFNGNSTAGNATLTIDSINSRIAFFGNSTAGNAAISNLFPVFGGETDFSGSSGPNGDNKLSAGSIAGSGAFVLGANQLTVGSNNLSTIVSGFISGTGGALVKIGTGTLTLTDINKTYTGATTVNGGMLEVDSSIAMSSQTTVNSGATLFGTGTVGNTQINSGSIFAPGALGTPGTSMTVQGNLAFQSGAIYLVQISPTTASIANVTTGTATINGGTVQALFNTGSYVAHQYDILHSTDGLTGAFTTLDAFGLPTGFTANLSYSGTDAFLNLVANMGAGPGGLGTGGLNTNQQNVANALNTFFNNGGTLPPNVLTIFGLTGSQLAQALSQLDGETSTDAEKGAFALMSQFLGLMLDPFVDGRTGSSGGGAPGFAPEQQASFPPDIALAYAGILKAPPQQNLDQRWRAWSASYGGSNTTQGNTALGTNNVTTGTFGFAAGMDYRFTPDTLAGFALAGAGTSWGLAQGLGSGRSDAFQAGVYGKTRSGPAYIAAALAYTDNWFTTNRTAPLGDQLTAKFNGQSFGGRIEAGYRYAAAPAIGVTPYAAVQAQRFHTPSYNEIDITGGGFGLSYNAMSATDTRSELGARFDDLTMFNAMPLVLRARLAWAHDWVTNPMLGAAFQSLPGASFTVNGAVPPKDSALTSVGAELHMTQNWSLAAKFDGEFAKGSQTYAGTGTLRYAW